MRSIVPLRQHAPLLRRTAVLHRLCHCSSDMHKLDVIVRRWRHLWPALPAPHTHLSFSFAEFNAFSARSVRDSPCKHQLGIVSAKGCGGGLGLAQGHNFELAFAHLVGRLDHDRSALGLACNGAHKESRTGGGEGEHQC